MFMLWREKIPLCVPAGPSGQALLLKVYFMPLDGGDYCYYFLPYWEEKEQLLVIKTREELLFCQSR